MIKKKYLIALALVILIGILINKWALRALNEPVVVLTKSGFSPAGLKVKIGTKVKFVNRTTLSFWPASDLHPNHAIYPEFDPKRALSPKEVWEFVFDRAGTFRFHDHLNPTNRGTVLVVEQETKVSGRISNEKDLLDSCDRDGEGGLKAVCLADLLGEIIIKRGPDYTFRLVNKLRETDRDFSSECHNIAHDLGGIAYWKYAKDKKLPKTGSISYCGFGFIHGFMTEFGHHSRDFIAGAKGVCDHFSKKINYQGFEQMLSPFDMCYHGIGHGLAYYYVPDLGDNIAEVVKRGAEDCRGFENETATTNCASGLFGGLSSVFVGGHGFKLELDKEDPVSLCRNQPSELKSGCYDNTIPVIGVYWPDVAKIASFFIGVEEEFMEQTFNSIGDYASRLLALNEVTKEEVISECNNFSQLAKVGCFYGFSQGIIRNYFPSEAPELALSVCRLAKLKETEKELCLKGVMTEVKNVLPNLYEETLML